MISKSSRQQLQDGPPYPCKGISAPCWPCLNHVILMCGSHEAAGRTVGVPNFWSIHPSMALNACRRSRSPAGLYLTHLTIPRVSCAWAPPNPSRAKARKPKENAAVMVVVVDSCLVVGLCRYIACGAGAPDGRRCCDRWNRSSPPVKAHYVPPARGVGFIQLHALRRGSCRDLFQGSATTRCTDPMIARARKNWDLVKATPNNYPKCMGKS